MSLVKALKSSSKLAIKFCLFAVLLDSGGGAAYDDLADSGSDQGSRATDQ